jgi:hypothetical protein
VPCPGEIILGAYDLAVALRDAGIAVAGGFHASMEQTGERVDLLEVAAEERTGAG